MAARVKSTTSRPPFDRLVIASRNTGKLAELEALLAPYGITLENALSLNLPEVVEDTGTFHGNAAKKAQSAAQATGLPALADDSGLCVDALGGAPGVETAHYGGWEKLLKALQNTPADQRDAHFVCVLALALPGHDAVHFFEGAAQGRIAEAPQGEGGFGYDPVFTPAGHHTTFATMARDAKSAISHRGQALRAFQVWLAEQSS